MTEVVFKLGDPIVATGFSAGSFFASEDGDANPAAIVGMGTWRKIPPATTVNELLNTSGEDDFVTIGSLYVWKRIS